MTPGGPIVPPGDQTLFDPVAEVLADPSLLTLHAQPIVDLSGGSVAGWELLARLPPAWHLSPDVFFAAVRAVGATGELNALVMEQGRRLLSTLPPNTFLTVNVDPIAATDPAFVAFVASLQGKRALDRIVVEITEHDSSIELDDMVAVVDVLRAHGALIAVDDLGAGYSGLNRLMALRPDFVKIDRALVSALGTDPAADEVIRALGAMCGRLDAWVIAEGVETEDQLYRLVVLDVPLGQGWFLGRPESSWSESPATTILRRLGSLRRISGPVIASVTLPLTPTTRAALELGKGRTAGVLTVAPETSISEALDRALARDGSSRWDPILVTDSQGTAVGSVRMEALIYAAVHAAESRAAVFSNRPA